MFKITNILMYFLIYKSVNSSSTFDQRQNGDVNVQVDLKNVQIIALMKSKEDYVDYDYAYDYSEMTIKPPNGTTKNPLNVTTTIETRDNITAVTPVSTDRTTEVINKINNSVATTIKDEVTLNPILSDSVTTRGDLDIKSTTIATTDLSNKNVTAVSPVDNDCKKGFVRNTKGNCELKLQNTSNALLKILKLSQKLKSKRENRRNVEDSI